MKTLDEILFEDRNKQYGAYENRKKYHTYLTWAVLAGVAIFSLLISIPLIASYINNVNSKDKVEISVDIDLKKPTEKIIKELPPLKEDKILKRAIFRVPFVTSDTTEVTDFFDIDSIENRIPADTTDIVFNVDTTEIIIIPVEKPTFLVVEEMPQFPGGEEARIKYLSENIKYPITAREIGLQGKVYLSFVVDEKGKVVEVTLLRGLGGGCDEEAMRVINGMPRWKPGRQNGEAVRVKFSMDINFKLAD